MNHSTPFPELNAVLATFLDQAQAILSHNFVGLYLVGSFALGDFDAHSDVDFLVVTHSDLTEAQEAALQMMHGAIYDLESKWAKHLEGSYIPVSQLRSDDATQTELLYLDNTASTMVRSNHCNTFVVRWTLYEYGIALVGPHPKTLLEAIPANSLIQEVRSDMFEWSEQLMQDFEQLNNRWVQAFVVLSYCRMLYTLEVGRITSKPAAAQWAKQNLDPKWVGLIEQAWLDRPNPSLKSKQKADPVEAQLTLDFARYALEYALEQSHYSLSQDQN